MTRRRTKRWYLSLLIALMGTLIACYGLPFPASNVAVATEATTDSDAAPSGPAPAPLPEPQRDPVEAPDGEKAASIVTPELPEGESPQEVVESLDPVPEEDSVTTNAYEEGEGSHILDITPVAQNYLGANGTWKEIDPTLVEAEGGYRNAAGPVQVFFPEQISSSSPITFSTEGNTFSATPVGIDSGGGSATGPPTAEGNSITYADALPGVDLQYFSIPEGYKENVILKAPPTTDRFGWDVSTTGFSLRLEASGGLSLLSGGSVVAVIPPPTVQDSNVDPETGQGAGSSGFSYALSVTGEGQYLLEVLFDSAWLADPARVFPVRIDPSPVRDLRPASDTDVSSCSPGTNYASDSYLRTGGSCARKAFIHFNIASWKRANRITYQARLDVFKLDTGGDETTVRKVTQDWTATSTNWNNQPSVGTVAWASTTRPANDWQHWEIGNLYQHLLDTSWEDYGIRLASANYNQYTSQNYPDPDGAPHLFIQYNDLPDAPSLLTPDNNATMSIQSPALYVSALPSDPNGDQTVVQFQVSDNGTTWTGDHLVWSSPWVDSKSYSVDAGALKDGQQYWWRARSADQCDMENGDLGVCSNKDAEDVVHEWAASNTRTFTVNLPHYGSDERWAMWSSQLGNGMTLKANQSNGNLFLDYPLDALQTPVGPLGVSLTYNSQLAETVGLGTGWNVAAGPLSDGTKLPVSLTKLAESVGDGVMIKFDDGDRLHFPHLGGEAYRGVGAGSGVVTHSPGATGTTPAWTYTTSSGSKYTFNSAGTLLGAKPSGDSWTKAGFDYTFDNSSPPRIQSITDPVGRTVAFSWTSTQLTITTWDARSWVITFSTAGISQVSDPENATVKFTYDPTFAKLGGIQDGQLVQDASSAKTKVDYLTRGSGWVVVDKVTGPDASWPTQFIYTGTLNGNVVEQASVIDPRGTATQGANDYRVWTDFDTGGLPIRIKGPYDENGVAPITRMVWDTNANLVCSRSPYANAVEEKCIKTAEATYEELGDPLNTDYTYQKDLPHNVLTVTGASPNLAGPDRPITTYAYDAGFTGLANQQFENAQLSGMPKYESISPQINFIWSDPDKPANLTYDTYWSIRWSGTITASATKRYLFRLKADDGARLVIDHAFLVDCWTHPHPFQSNCGAGDAQKWMKAGEPVPITVEYFHGENNGGSNPPHIELSWNQGNGDWQVVPASALKPDLNLMTSVQDPLGTTTWSYPNIDDKVKRLPTAQARGTRTTAYVYDDYARLLTETDPLGNATQYTYTDSLATKKSCLTQKQDRTGAVTNYECNQAGDVTRATQIVRAVAGTNQTTQQSRVTDTTYDGLGRVKTVSVPYAAGGAPAAFTVNEYDKAGRLTTTTTPMGFTTAHQYDARGRMVKKILPLPDPDGGGPLPPYSVSYAYDDAGNQTQVTDANGHVWSKTYDALNRVLTSKDPKNNKTTTNYDLLAKSTTVTDEAGVQTTTVFDLLGRKVSESLGNFSPTTYEYDQLGNVLRVEDPAGIYVEKTYTQFGEVDTEIRPTGSALGAPATTDYGYDNGGRLVTVVDPRGHATSYTYDPEGRIATASLPPPDGQSQSLGVTTLVYDDAGERLKVTDGAGKIRNWTYNVRGQMATFSDARGATTYSHDDDGRLVQEDVPSTDPVTPLLRRKYQYDELGRRLRRWGEALNGSGQTVVVDDERFTYDPVGNLEEAASVSNPSLDLTMDYDSADRLTKVTQGSAITQYGYTKTQLTSRIDPAGTTSFTYRNTETDGLVATITDPLGSGTISYGYDTAGRQVTRTDPSGLVTTRTYEGGSGRLDTQKAVSGNGSGTELASFDMEYDESSNVTKKIQTVQGYGAENGTWRYTYDNADRMITAKDSTAVTTTYGYDGAGNRTSVKVGSAAAVTTTYDDAGFPDASSDGTDYTVDALGRTRAIDRNGSVTDYKYDTWDRIRNAVTPTANVTYIYDAFDRTASRAKGSSTTQYKYVGLTEDLASITQGATTTAYSYTQGGPFAQKQGSAVRFLLTDFHEDLVGLFDQASQTTLAGRTAYDPWGKRRVNSGEQALLGFQGDLTDEDTGLVDITTRVYDPSLGRFNTRDSVFGDPRDPLSLNQFGYTQANPITYADPTGLMQAEPHGSSGPGCAPNCHGSDWSSPYEGWTASGDPWWGVNPRGLYAAFQDYGPVARFIPKAIAAAREFGISPRLMIGVLLIEGQGWTTFRRGALAFDTLMALSFTNPSIGVTQMKLETFRTTMLLHFKQLGISAASEGAFREQYAKAMRHPTSALRYAAAHLADLRKQMLPSDKDNFPLVAATYNAGIDSYRTDFVPTGQFGSSADRYRRTFADLMPLLNRLMCWGPVSCV